MKLFTIMLLTAMLVLPVLAAEKADPKKIDEIPAISAVGRGPAKPAENVKFDEPLTPAAPTAPALQPLPTDNSALLQAWMSGQQEVPTGFACPKCGKELLKNVKIHLSTNPPMAIFVCSDKEKCKFMTVVF